MKPRLKKKKKNQLMRMFASPGNFQGDMEEIKRKNKEHTRQNSKNTEV